ncbi:dUTP diphosphatase [uncultured Desulfovibrio sp.]|uniref:dUTP diphosphatase n=1 Tax=uncultured Desulfovibrio sp. TaxID=167968 RepID=UPI0025EB23F0|nr:dUTP diphosphatase [uncultured Desulfovibrio sp.]
MDITGPPPDGALPVRVAFARPGARELYARAGGDLLAPATPLSAGLDLRACLAEEEARIAPGARLAVPAGISVQPVRPGYAGFVYSRSGLGARDGLTVAQGVGVIDPDYTGEILVILLNTSGEERTLRRGERVAQLVFQPYARPAWEEVPRLLPTERGAGGFGHTGR